MLERTILSNLIFNKDYSRKVIPHLKDEYFSDRKYKAIFHILNSYIGKYNQPPSIEALKVDISGKEGLPENLYYEIVEELEHFKPSESENDSQWLLDTTENFLSRKSIV